MAYTFSPGIGHFPAIGRLGAGLTAVTALALASCASVPPPDGAMNMAQTHLQAARDADASDYAPVDLGFAQDKFQQAQTAMAQRDYAAAGQLATEAQADADLARAKARLAAVRAKINTQLAENSRLRRQVEQAHPDLPPPAFGGSGAAAAASAPASPAAASAPTPGFAPVPAAPSGAAPAPSTTPLAPPAANGGSMFESVPSPASSQGGQP